ncbi:hypothetical protein [Streptomyces californicus]|uniref:hypothetical protein n=1 Tax=Streptomyces californicus TaxID=67351 RepID=UPI0036BC2053
MELLVDRLRSHLKQLSDIAVADERYVKATEKPSVPDSARSMSPPVDLSDLVTTS